MDEVLHANVFFVIASVAVVVFCVLVCFILYHVLKIVRSVRAIVERIEAGSGMIADDVAYARSWVYENVLARFFGMIGKKRTRMSRKPTPADDETESL